MTLMVKKLELLENEISKRHVEANHRRKPQIITIWMKLGRNKSLFLNYHMENTNYSLCEYLSLQQKLEILKSEKLIFG